MANNILIKDGGGVNVTVKTTEDLGPPVVHTPHHIVDSIVAALPTGGNAIGSVALSATDNAVLDAIVVNTGTNATEAKQDAIIADTAAIQTAVELIDDAVYADDADWTDGSSKHLLVGGLYQSSPQSVTDGDVAPIQLDANGRVGVALSPTDNAVLDTIDAVLDTINGKVTACNTGAVVVSSVTLPTTGFTGITFYDHSGGSAVQLAASGALKSGVTVKAYSGNAAAIFVGFSNITATTSGTNTTGGIELAAKESIFIEVDSLSDVYIRGGADGLVTYIGT